MDKRKEAVINLDFPVQLADRELTQVTMRRPVMKDMVNHDVTRDSSLKTTVALLADLCGMPPDELELLDTVDFEKLQDQLLQFRGVDKS